MGIIWKVLIQIVKFFGILNMGGSVTVFLHQVFLFFFRLYFLLLLLQISTLQLVMKTYLVQIVTVFTQSKYSLFSNLYRKFCCDKMC